MVKSSDGSEAPTRRTYLNYVRRVASLRGRDRYPDIPEDEWLFDRKKAAAAIDGDR